MSNYTIQTGVWINHSEPPVLGATLTVSIRWGNYLIAALSSLVAWAGSRAWAILYFYLHQRLAAIEPGSGRKDILHQQLQVHFRASGSFWDGLGDGIDLYRAWSGRLDRVKRRTLSLVVGAVLFFITFAAAGVFVAEVASQSNQDVLVLALPNDCGDLAFQDSVKTHNEYLDAVMRYQSDAGLWARNYARDAYNGSNKGRFDAFAQARLPLFGRETTCPYSGNVTCLGVNGTKGGAAWLMETGRLDSHEHFGFNAPPADRVSFRKSVTCAVVDPTALTTKLYSRVEKDMHTGANVNKTYIGILQQFAEDIGGDSNLAFEIPVSLANERVGFYIQRGNYAMGNNDPTKDLTGPPFLRNDADVVLSAVAQTRMFYYGPVDDPLFLAHEATTGEEYAYDMNVTVYYPSRPFGLMACSEQQQFCQPGEDGACTEPNGANGWRDALLANAIGLSPAQMATAIAIFNAHGATGAGFGNFAARGNSGLTVAETRGVRASQSIGPTQWRDEVGLWFASSIVSMQVGLQAWVSKPWPQGHPETWSPVVNISKLNTVYESRGLGAAKDRLCQNQLIRSSAAMQNFSVLALVLVIVFCVTIIVTASVLPACVTCLRQRKRRRAAEAARAGGNELESGGSGSGLSAAAEAGEVARLADGKYSLLAMALASAGVGPWERSSTKPDAIPVTRRGSGQAGLCRPLERKDSGLAAYPCIECGLCGSGKVKGLLDGEDEKSRSDTDSLGKEVGDEAARAGIVKQSEQGGLEATLKTSKGHNEEAAKPDISKETKPSREERKPRGSLDRIRRCATEKTLIGSEDD